jgi:4-amino-4-deoxy-L-arabinose transferase-like glycosyltransferase
MNQYRFLLILLLLTYWAISLLSLDSVPGVHQDEPWQASTGWKIAQTGVFGSDLFTGFHGMEQHYYAYMPVHPLILAVFYRAGGLGLWQTRLETVTLGLLTLALTYHLGQKYFSRPVGLLAVAGLLLVRHTSILPHHPTGVLFLDVVRIGRYDVAVPVFGLAALALYGWGTRGQGKFPRLATLLPYHLIMSGLLVGLAALSHVYGLFWLVALVFLAIWDGVSGGKKPGCTHKPGFWVGRTLFYLGVGFVLPMLGYVAYVLPGWSDWLAQTQGYSPRFDLFNPSWYGQNLLHEVERYHPGFDSVWRPGLLATIIIFPLSLFWLIRRGWQGDSSARLVVVPAIVFPVLFALLIYLKLSNYLVTVLPVWLIMLAWGSWQIVTRQRSLILRVLLVGMGILVAGEGAGRIMVLSYLARTNTPYAEFAAALHTPIPPGSRVLGLHDYWLGFQDTDYRSWFVPLALAGGRYEPFVQSIRTSLDQFQPQFVLIDPQMRNYLENSSPEDQRVAAIKQWLMENHYASQYTVDDPTYGRIDIYRPVEQPFNGPAEP